MFTSANAQNYQLLPDSCTHCFYQYYGGSGFQDRSYGVYPNEDTTINANSYLVVREESSFIAGVRQDGDKLLGVLHDQPFEQVLMDWSGDYGDTIKGLYSYSGYYYDAIVKYKGEVVTPSGEVHKYQTLQGVHIYFDSVPGPNDYENLNDWILRWDEKGLCGTNVPYAADDSTNYKLSELNGGLYYGYAQNDLIIDFYEPLTCTGDTIYDSYTQATGLCQQCEPVHPNASLVDHKQTMINFYPNPIISGQSITIETEDNSIDEIKIFNLQGKLVQRTSIDSKSTFQLNVPFESGLYMMVMLANRKIIHFDKLIVK